jgi:hypothetical protein
MMRIFSKTAIGGTAAGSTTRRIATMNIIQGRENTGIEWLQPGMRH